MVFLSDRRYGFRRFSEVEGWSTPVLFQDEKKRKVNNRKQQRSGGQAIETQNSLGFSSILIHSVTDDFTPQQDNPHPSASKSELGARAIS